MLNATADLVREFDHTRQVFRRVGIEALLDSIINAVQLTPDRESGWARVLWRLEAKFDREVRGTPRAFIYAIRNYHGGRAEGFDLFEQLHLRVEGSFRHEECNQRVRTGDGLRAVAELQRMKYLGIRAGRLGHLQHALRSNAKQRALRQEDEI